MSRIRTLLTILALAFAAVAYAQKNIVELSPALRAKSPAWLADSIGQYRFIIDSRAVLPASSFTLHNKGNGIYILRASPYHLLQWAKSIAGHVFIDEQVRPATEAGVLNYDMTLNMVTAAWKAFPDINGKGEVISIQEDKPDSLDPDLLGKFRASPLISPRQDNHATIMSTLALGSGNSSFRGKGVAHKASYSSSDFINVLPGDPGYYRAAGIQVQNHSYGTGIQNFYGVNARAFDLSVSSDSTLLHVFSAGNSGTSTSGQGLYASIPGVANITGNMKMAKNVLLVGAILENESSPPYTSKGPLYDGRIAPHVVAMGDDGTSGAAAITSGTAALVQQIYKKENGRPAPSHLVRAVLINAAKDLGAEGPDYTTGFGSLDANAALGTIASKSFFNGSVPAGGESVFAISVPAGAALLKVTLAWNDTAAASGAAKALLNDLDLRLVNQQTGEVWHPWVLSSFPQLDSLRKPAGRGMDSLNNVEQVSLHTPSAGQYLVYVRGRSLQAAPMSFSVAYSVSAEGVFRWTYPLAGDQLAANENLMLRWRSTLAEQSGKIEMSRDRGLSWQLLNDNVNLAGESFPLVLPDSLIRVRFRVSVPGRSFETADVVSSPSISLNYGYVCDTTLLAYWNRIKGASSYRLYRLANDTMMPVALVPDTFAISSRAGSPYFAVAGVLDQEEGLRGSGVDYRRQNTGCYISSFLAALAVNKANISLALGSLFQVKKVEVYKVSDNDRVLLSVEPMFIREFSIVDDRLHQGLNVYRTRITLANGSMLYSDEAVVYYLDNKSHIIYPNPSSRGTAVFIITENVDDEDADVIDMQGRIILQVKISDKQQKLPFEALSKGSYFLRISKDGKTVQVLRFLQY